MELMKCGMPDYESECKRLTAENNRLVDLNEQFKLKLREVECQYKDLYSECIKLRGQMEIVRLIFGRK